MLIVLLEQIVYILLITLNLNVQDISTISHERNLIWAQKESGRNGVARLVGVNGNPADWVVNRTATTRYITAPNNNWVFMALAFDYKEQTIYWSDAGNKKIQGLRLDGSNAAFIAHQGTSGHVYGLALDWLSGTLYWSDARYNWILAVNGQSNSSEPVVIVDTELEEPRGLAVHPGKGYLFWCDSGSTPKIERSLTTGANRTLLITTELIAPSGLVIDYTDDILYWADNGVISSVDMDGQRRWTHFTLDNTEFFAISLYQNFLFATDQNENQLYVFDRDHSQHEVNFRLSAKPWGVMMYEEERQALHVTDGCQSADCDQVCASLSDGDHTCLCGRGFSLSEDGKSCQRNKRFGTPRFIYSISNALCQFPGNLADMSLTNVSLDTQCFLKHRRAAHALATDVANDVIFIAENNTKTISRVKLTNNEEAIVITGGTGSVEGLTFDWLSKNLYWTDSVYKHVMVATTDGRYQKRIIHGQLDHPRSVIVNPIARFLYWSDVGPTPKIERSNLDGSNRTVVVQDNIGSPNHLALDLHRKELCWTDSVFDQIECIGFDGQNRKTILSLPRTEIYGLAVYQDYVVWTDHQRRNGIHVGSRVSGQKIRGVIHPAVGKASDVITFDESAQPTATNPCSFNNGECSHLCFAVQDEDTPTCMCASGYESTSGGDGISCETESPWDDLLLVTDTYRKQVYHVPLSTGEAHPLPGVNTENPIAVDYDPEDGRVFWTDVSLAAVQSIMANGSGQRVVRSLPEGSIPDGIAVDAISRLLFYTDAGRKLIAVMTLDGSFHKVIVTEGLDHPRAIAADPIRGHIYWTDWGEESRIEKSAMDGSDRRHLVDTGKGGWPNGLTIDELGARLFWCDAYTDRIESCDLNGHGRRTIYREDDSHFFGIAVLGGIIFYTDWTKKTIMRLQHTGNRLTSSVFGPPLFARLNDIHIYRSSHNIYGLKVNECSVNNGQCPQLCLPVNFTRVCACSDDETTTASSDCTRPYAPTSTPTPPVSSAVDASDTNSTSENTTQNPTNLIPQSNVTREPSLTAAGTTTPEVFSSSVPVPREDATASHPHLTADTPPTTADVTAMAATTSPISPFMTTKMRSSPSTQRIPTQAIPTSTKRTIPDENRGTETSMTTTSTSTTTKTTTTTTTISTTTTHELIPPPSHTAVDPKAGHRPTRLTTAEVSHPPLATAHITEIHRRRTSDIPKTLTTLPVSDFVHGLSGDFIHFDRNPHPKIKFEKDQDQLDIRRPGMPHQADDYSPIDTVGDVSVNAIQPSSTASVTRSNDNTYPMPTTVATLTVREHWNTEIFDIKTDLTDIIAQTVATVSPIDDWTTHDVNSNINDTVINISGANSTGIPAFTRRPPIDDFKASMSALLAILVAGVVLMCIIVMGGVILYRKLDPNRRTPRCGRRPETALTSLSDVYELPSSKATHPLACRYASMHDLFYTGSTEDGLDNLSYTPRDVNTYEEIVEESSRGHSFSTFR